MCAAGSKSLTVPQAVTTTRGIVGEKNCFRTTNAPAATQGLRCKRPVATPQPSSSTALLIPIRCLKTRYCSLTAIYPYRVQLCHSESIPCLILARPWSFISMVHIHKLRQVEGMDVQQLREQQNDHDSMTDGSGPRPQVCLSLPHGTIVYST